MKQSMTHEDLAFNHLKLKISVDNSAEAISSAQIAIFRYLTNILHLYEENDSEKFEIKEYNYVSDQLMQFFLYLKKENEGKDKPTLMTVNLYRLLGRDLAASYYALLQKADSKLSSKLMDLVNTLTDIFIGKGKKISMHGNWYSSLKHGAVIILQFLFERFNGFLNSYKEELLTALYKHLTKCYDNYNTAVEDSIFRANYFSDMTKLINVILSNDYNSNVLTEKLTTRLFRLCKNILSRDSKEHLIFPIPSLAQAIDITSVLLKSDRYTSTFSLKKVFSHPDYFLITSSKYLERMISCLNTDHKELRLVITKNITDILTFDYIKFGVNLGDSKGALERCLSFVISRYMCLDSSETMRIGMIETLIQFLAQLNLAYKTGYISVPDGEPTNFVSSQSLQILTLIYAQLFSTPTITASTRKTSLKEQQSISDKTTEETAFRTLRDLNIFYRCFLQEVGDDANKLVILENIFSKEGEPIQNSKLSDSAIFTPISQFHSKKQTYYYWLALLELAQLIIKQIGEYLYKHLENFGETHDNVGTQISQQLFLLSTCGIPSLQWKTTEILIQVLQIQPELSHRFVDKAVSRISCILDTKGNGTLDNFEENRGLAFFISSALTYCNNSFVSPDIDLRIFSLCQGYLKKYASHISSGHFKDASSTVINNDDYQKQASSWVLLTGLFNFEAKEKNDENLFWIDPPQMLQIWKSILGYSLPDRFIKDTFVDGQTQADHISEIWKVVETKSYALACLCSYIDFALKRNSIQDKNTPDGVLPLELTGNINNLLLHCFNFVKNLFTIFKETKIRIPDILKSSLLTNQVRIYTVLVKIIPYLNVKTDLSSTIFLQVVDDFAGTEPPLFYTETNSIGSHAKGLQDADKYGIYKICDGLCYGLTSKFDKFMVQSVEVNSRSQPAKGIKNNTITRGVDTSMYLKPVSIFDKYTESWSGRRNSHNIANDYMFLLSNFSRTKRYTNCEAYPVRHDIMIVDLAIEIFSLVFPSLGAKVQQSIIENIRSSTFLNGKKSLKVNGYDQTTASNKVDTLSVLRKRAIITNCSIAFYEALTYLVQKNDESPISAVVLDLISRTLKNFDNEDCYLSEINSRSIGLITTLSRHTGSDETMQSILSSTMKSIIKDNNPLIRAFNVKTLTRIIDSCEIPCTTQVLQILMMLCLDPHPVVHSASIDALSIIISSQSPTDLDLSYIWKTLEILEKTWIDDVFGISSPTTVCCNMNCRDYLSSEVLLSKVIRKIVGFSGPLISGWSQEQKTTLKDLIFVLIYLNEDHVSAISREVLKCLEELDVFDRSLFVQSTHLQYLEFLLQNNFELGVYNASLTCIPLESTGEKLRTSTLYPMTTSVTIWRMCLDFLQQYIKIHPDILQMRSEIESLLWIALEIRYGCIQAWGILRTLMSHDDADKALWVTKLVKYFDSNKYDLWKAVLDSFKFRMESSNTIPKVAVRPLAENTENVPGKDSSSRNSGQLPSRKYSEESDDEFEGNQEALNVSGTNTVNDEDTAPSGQYADRNTKVLSLNPFSLRLSDTNWEFRLRIILMLNETMTYAKEDMVLRNKLVKQISDLVRIAFIGTTSGMPTLRLASLKLLQYLIDIYANAKDPATNNDSLLCQQQAQIIAAISPAFEEGSNADIASEAILILSKLITTGVTPVNRVGRVLQILTSALENMAINNSLSSSTRDDIIKIGKLQISTQSSKDKVRYHLLQSWAYIKTENNKDDDAVTALINKYNNILVPLWFYSLRNYAIKRYGETNLSSGKEFDCEIFSSHCWAGILKASTQTVAETPQKFLDLMGDEAANFILVVLAQCIENLIRLSSGNRADNNDLEAMIIRSLDELLSLNIALTILFKKLIFTEFIDLFDRLVFVSNYNVKLEIIKLTKTIFEGYFKHDNASIAAGEEVSNDVDELFELIRLNILLITNILPFLKDGDITSNNVKMVDSDVNILKESFDAVIEMAQFLPEVMRIDIFSCTLYMLSLIYKFGNKKIISTLLPSLKRILTSFAMIDPENINVTNFFITINHQLELHDNTSLITVLILVSTIENMNLRGDDFDDISKFLIMGLESEDAGMVALTTRTINTLIKRKDSKLRDKLLSKLIPIIIDIVGSEVDKIQEPRLMIEILVAFIRGILKNGDRLLTAYSVFVPVMLWFATIDNDRYRSYIHVKLHELIKISPEIFKKYVLGLSEEKKMQIEDLVKYASSHEIASIGKSDVKSKPGPQKSDDQLHINLKQFE